jgi:hypothetical protein
VRYAEKGSKAFPACDLGIYIPFNIAYTYFYQATWTEQGVALADYPGVKFLESSTKSILELQDAFVEFSR